MMARRSSARPTPPGGSLRSTGGALPDLSRLGASVILAAALVHAATMFASLPWWDMSPLVVTPTMSGMGPAQSMVANAGLLAGALLVFMGQWRRGETIHILPLALAAIGAVGVVLHGWVLPTRGLANQHLGATWIAGILAAVAMLHACRDERTRRLTIAVIIGFLALLAIKGAQQRFIDHPRTLVNYEQNREQILAAQGWTAGSPMALGYERRLKQSDPSAWFGLSNVYASFMAAGVAALVATLAAAIRRRAAKPWVMATLGALLAATLGALALTYSKGGIGALALGLATLAALLWTQSRAAGGGAGRTNWLPKLVILIAVAAPIAGVVLRGPLGERLGDRSLLFRWYYWQGAARITADHPVVGVGPAGFQEAYLAARPPLSVEEVTSPHGLPFDFAATLGLFGLAWVGLFLVLALRMAAPIARTGDGGAAPVPAGDHDADREETRVAFLVAGVVALLGTWLDMQVVLPHGPTVTLDRAAVWVAGLLAWWGVTAAFLRLGRACPAAPALAATAGAVVLAIHAQIEVTGVQPGSATLFFLLLGAAAARAESPACHGRARRVAPSLAVAATAGLAALVAHSAWRAMTWQGHLRRAAEALAPVSDIRGRLTAPETEPDAARLRAEALADLSRLVGRPVQAPEPWLTMLQLERLPAAVNQLGQAEAMFNDQWRLSRAAAWLLLEAGATTRAMDEDASDRLLEEARRTLAPGPGATPTGRLRAYGTLLKSIAEITGERAPLEQAALHLAAAAERDPLNLPLAVSLARLHDALNHPEQAARWASRALELEGFKRLDAGVHGLSQADRESMQQLAVP